MSVHEYRLGKFVVTEEPHELAQSAARELDQGSSCVKGVFILPNEIWWRHALLEKRFYDPQVATRQSGGSELLRTCVAAIRHDGAWFVTARTEYM